MLETVRAVGAGVSHIAAQASERLERASERLERELTSGNKKSRKSTGSTPSRSGGALAEALRARGGTKNLDTVISHISAASDTEAFAPKRRSSGSSLTGGGQGKKRLARAATTDDDFGERPSSQANLGWLDLQAFAPRALQRQLERLADSVDNPLLAPSGSDEEPSGSRGIGGLFDLIGSGGNSSGSLSARGTSSSSSSGNARNPLLASLQKRGGVGVNASRESSSREAEQQNEVRHEVVESQEEADLEPVPPPLPSVPEEEEGDASLSLVIHGSTNVVPPEGNEEEEIADDGLDVRDDSAIVAPHISITEERSNDLKSDDIVRESTTNSSVPEAAYEMTSAETTEDPLEVTDMPPSVLVTSAETAEETVEVSDMPPSVPVTSAETVEETVVEVTRDVPSVSVTSTETVEVRAEIPTETASTKVEISLPVLADVPTETASTKVETSLPVEGKKLGVAAQWRAAVESSNAERRPSVSSVDSLKPRPSASSIDSLKPKATESTRPPIAQWCPVVETAKPVKPADATNDDKEKAKPKAKAEKNSFSNSMDFWKNHTVRFAGPTVGNKGISKVEAQAALQRLLSNSSAVDCNELRRLRKQVENSNIST